MGVLVWLVAADVLLLVLAGSLGGHWVANTQVAYITSALVMAASMFGYRQMVHRRLEAGTVMAEDNRDTIDHLEDPFDLYGEASSGHPDMQYKPNADAPTIREAIRDEKQRMKQQRRSLPEIVRDARPALSAYRLIAYGLLLFGFFYLNGHHLFLPLPYLIGLGIPVAVMVAAMMGHGEAHA